MRRRNLIVHSDSDEEDGAGMATTTTPASVSASVASGGGSGSVVRLSPPNPSPVPVPFPSLSQSSAPFVISDDDEEADDIVDPDGDSPIVDAPEAFSPPPPPSSTPAPASPPPPTTTPFRTPIQTPPARTPTPIPTQPPSRTPASTTPPHPSPLNGRLRPVDDFLRRLGLLLRPDWLESCAAGIPGFDGLRSAEAQARRCFEQFLFADMDACGAGVLPEGVGGMHAVSLDGPFVLQVDEIVNISAPLKERYREVSAGPKRCLKLSMTDGVQRIFGMEYRSIKDLAVLAPAGLKIIIRNVHIRRGLLMLVPEAIEILGGVVDELEAARDRLVSEVNKPPRGRRKQGGLPLSSRATQAAWPHSNNITNGGEQGISVQGAVNSSYPTRSGNTLQFGRATETVAEELVRPPVVEQIHHLQETNMQGLSASLVRETTETSTHTTHKHEPTHTIERSTQAIMEECVAPPIIANNVDEQMQRVQEITMQEQATAFGSSERASSVSTPCGYVSQRFSHAIDGTAANAVEVARSPNVDEINQMEPSFILSGENEQPFTYIYSMLVDWGRQEETTAYIQGKIQGVITSVKNFQYKQRTEYELYVYIDDGSFISEAFIDNHIVKNMLGLSPEEVTAALSGELEFASPSEVKGTLKGFQRFLVKFEGVMLIEFNKNSSIPIIRELNEGCSGSSTVWLLLRRLKTFSQKRVQSLDIMDTTP